MGKPREVLALAAAAVPALLLSFSAAAAGPPGGSKKVLLGGSLQNTTGCSRTLVQVKMMIGPMSNSLLHTSTEFCRHSQQNIGSADDDSDGGLKVYMYIYGLPEKDNKPLKKEPRCLNYMFAVEIFMERFLLPSVIQILIPRMQFGCTHTIQMCSAIEQITMKLPYRNRSREEIISLSHHMTLVLASVMRKRNQLYED